MDIFNQAISFLERGGEIARKMRLLEISQQCIPSEAIPKSLNELTNNQWCSKHYALYYPFHIHEQSSIQTTKYYSEENRVDMERKVKHLVKEVRKERNKAMQLESVQLFSNVGYTLQSGPSPRNIN